MGGTRPNSIFFFLGKFTVFCVVFMFPNVSKKKLDRGVGGFWIFKNLTRPLAKIFLMISDWSPWFLQINISAL